MKSSNYDDEWFKFAQPIQNVSGSNSSDIIGSTYRALEDGNLINKESHRMGRQTKTRTKMKSMVILYEGNDPEILKDYLKDLIDFFGK